MESIRRLFEAMEQSVGAPSRRVRDVAAQMLTFLATLALMVVGLVSSPTRAADEAESHAHHHHMVEDTTRSVADYKVPDIQLVRDDGKIVTLSRELDDGRPVVLSFIYTSCTTICPVTSQALSELQGRLGAARDSVHIVSISIDPEQDTPARLLEYGQRFSAGPEWQHYTGTVAAIVASEKAFGVYRGDKMSHAPVTLFRTARGGRWVRIDGFASPDQMLAELRSVVAVQ